jgi:small subunit ribosomal protein S13
MARIAGVNIPNHQHAEIALNRDLRYWTQPSSFDLQLLASIALSTKMKDLTEAEMDRLRDQVGKFTVEGDLRREVTMSIKRLMDLGCYRGLSVIAKACRVVGQRTRTNARTRKGPA